MAAHNNTPRVCIVGAGFSGLCMGIKLTTILNLETFTIYEACAEVGGTWFVNTYPGCACDVPSHLYSFSFSPKSDWSHAYSPQEEILEYAKDVARKYELYPHIRFQTKVQCLRWHAAENKWHATILNTRTNEVEQEEFDIIVNGTGKIRIPHYPQEYSQFKGPILHSAEWDSSISLSGKKVGIVGTGASAVQIITAVAPLVENLTVFQRKAPHIIPRPQFEYPDTLKWAFSKIPGLLTLSRYSYFWMHESMYTVVKHNSLINKVAEKVCRWYRNSQIQDPGLREKTTPKYTLGCKRLVLSESYYRTLTRNNVELVTEKVESAEGHCIQTRDGKKYEFDVLILATGYQPHDFFSPMKVYGRGGVDVLQEWKTNRPEGYLGILSRDIPNFFTLLGPYTAVGHSSNMFNIECQVDWTISVIQKVIEKGARSVSIVSEAEERFMKVIDKTIEDSVWINGNCEPWYLDAKGRNTTLWPGSQIEFWKLCRSANDQLFEFTY